MKAPTRLEEQIRSSEHWQRVATKGARVVVSTRCRQHADHGREGVVFWCDTRGTVGIDTTGRRTSTGLRADPLFVHFSDLDPVSSNEPGELMPIPQLHDGRGLEPAATWTTSFEASDLQIPVGQELQCFKAYNTRWQLERRELRDGELVAWHYSSPDGRRITIFND